MRTSPPEQPPTSARSSTSTAAGALRPVIQRLGIDEGGLPFAVRLWDDSEIPATDPSAPTLMIHSRTALARVLRSPNELGMARAWVTGELEFEGDVERGLAAAQRLRHLRVGAGGWLAIAVAAVRLGALRLKPPKVPDSEARLTGRRRSLRRDRAAISYHYDMPDAFYELVLGPTRGYTCGYYAHPDESLEDSQMRKFDRVCAKLQIQPGERMLDIGCGWGSLMIHAARHYDAHVVGVTISASQADEVRCRIRAAGVADRCEVRLCDWRQIDDGPYDKIASVEMIEHVGPINLPHFYAQTHGLLAPGGSAFTQAIVRDVPSSAKGSSPFIARYIFPDGQLVSITELIAAITAADLEIRDLESLRAHYPPTLRAWAANLNANRDEAIELVGIERVRAWDLYLAATALVFERNALSVYQITATAPPARPHTSAGSSDDTKSTLALQPAPRRTITTQFRPG